MVSILRRNHEAEIHAAPKWFLDYASRALSVPVEMGQRPGSRFGKVWYHQGEPWGSLMRVDGAVAIVPAGLTAHIQRLAEHYRLPYSLRDVRLRPEDRIPWWSVSAKWRPYQDWVHNLALNQPCGIIDAPPRSGKTLMAARLIDTLACPTLFVAPTLPIVKQTYDVLVEHFGEDLCARLDGQATPEQRDISKPIVVATAVSASRQEQAWFDTRELLIVDEFHHAASETYHRISSKAVNAFYRYMFTGTHFRTGDDGLAMEAICSNVLASIPLPYLVEHRFLAHPRITFLPVRGRIAAQDWREAYEVGIVDYAPRNDMIVRLAHNLALDNGVPTIVLTRRRRHADLLGEQISESVVVKGGENALTSRSVRRFLDGHHQVLVGTTVLGEGVDVPRAAALIYASGHSDGVTMMQSYFRPLTARDDKPVGRIYDFYDRHHRTLAMHSKKRLNFARTKIGEACVFNLNT